MVRTTSTAYTLVELMVVLAVIGVIALIAVFGLNSFSNGQNVENAAKQFVTDMRSLQNQAVNGGIISDSSGNRLNDGYIQFQPKVPAQTSYILPSGTVVNLPKGVYLWEDTLMNGAYICFSNPSVTTQPCNKISGGVNINLCIYGSGFYCDGSNSFNSPALNICFSNDPALAGCQKKVTIEGTGWTITRIYEQ